MTVYFAEQSALKVPAVLTQRPLSSFFLTCFLLKGQSETVLKSEKFIKGTLNQMPVISFSIYLSDVGIPRGGFEVQ